MRKLAWPIIGSLLILLATDRSICSAKDQDLILMMSLSEEHPLTAAELHGLVEDAIQPGKPVEGMSVTPVPRRLYDRFARIIGKGREATPNENEPVRQVTGDLFKWHIKGFGSSPDTPRYSPEWVVLKWKQYSLDGQTTDHTQEFAVAAPTSTDTTAVVQSLQGDNQTLLVRADESWEVLGYRMEWKGSGDTRLQDPADNGFHPWGVQPPCFLVVIPNFENYGKPLSEIYGALREKVSEFLEVNSPDRPLKLVALDLEPVDRAAESPYFQQYYTLRLAKSREATPTTDPHAWAIFPLTTAQKDEYLVAIQKVETDSRIVPGGGARAVPTYIDQFRNGASGPGYFPIAEPIEDVPELASRRLEQPTGVFDAQWSPQWYEVPAVLDQAPGVNFGNVMYFSRTLKVNNAAASFEDNKAWAIVVYARKVEGVLPVEGVPPVEGVLRAGKLSQENGTTGPEYAVAVEVPFVNFLQSLKKPKAAKNGNN